MIVAVAILAGTLLAVALALVPGMHAYNILGVLVLFAHAAQSQGQALPATLLVPGAVALVTAFAVLSSIPAVFLASPEESGFFMVQPGRKYLRRGRGFDAVAMTAVGALGGLLLALPVLAIAGPRILPVMRAVLTPHQHWIVWSVIAFMIQSEWPRGGLHGPAGARKLLDGWRSLGVGLATFALSGLLGLLLFYRNPTPPHSAFQGLMPAFAGLFTLPWLLVSLFSTHRLPAQTFVTARLNLRTVLKGTLAGTLGGSFAAFIPGITGGVGGMLAGHATATRDDRTFLISQGASKMLYYTGGLLLLLTPGLHLRRGGAAALLNTVHTPDSADFLPAIAAAALSAALALLLLRPASRLVVHACTRIGYRRMCTAALLCTLLVVLLLTGTAGLAIAAVAAGIGLIPVLFGGRRMNCLGVILLPIACNLSGIGETLAGMLGLLGP